VHRSVTVNTAGLLLHGPREAQEDSRLRNVLHREGQSDANTKKILTSLQHGPSLQCRIVPASCKATNFMGKDKNSLIYRQATED
jgi:hypothetical protein